VATGRFSKDPSVDRALRHSVRDGMAYSVQVGAGETYFSAFALFLNATAAQVALLSTLPPLLGSSAQIFSAWLGTHFGRRRLVLWGCTLQALLWLPILLVPLLFAPFAIPALLVLLALYQGANNLSAPQWTSIMRDLVSERRRGRYFGYRTQVTTITTFVALVIVVAADAGFYAVVGTAAVGAAVTLAITWVLVRREAHPVPRAERSVWRRLLVTALPVGAALAVSEVFFRLDTLLVSAFRSYHEVGLYSLSYRIVELIAILPAIVMTSVFPLLSRHLHESRDRAVRTIDAAGDLFVAVGAPIAAGGLIVAPELVTAIGGEQFADAADALRILLFAVALAFVSGLFGHSLIAGGRQTSALRLGLAALGFNLAFNLVAIPAWGIEGAAAVAVASEVLLVAGGYLLVRRDLGLVPRFALLWRALVAAAVMGVVLALVPEWPVAVLIALGALLYAAALWALGGIDPRRLGELRT